MGMTKVTVVAHTEALLGAGAVFLSDVLDVSGILPRTAHDGYSMLKGFVNSDQNCTVDVYQGTHAQVAAVLPGVPAAATGDGAMRLDTIGHVGAAASPGTPLSFTIRGASLIARVTNTGGAQATFQFHLEAAE